MNLIKVLIAEDHALFRRGIQQVLSEADGIQVVAEAADGLEALEKANSASPDVVLTDLSMPNCGGLDLIKALKVEQPQINILVLTISEEETDLFSAMKFGAKGYLLKSTDSESLIRAIFHIAQGGAIVSPLMAEKLLQEISSSGSGSENSADAVADSGVSPRELEILEQLTMGFSNKQIADTLFISENTVKTHLRRIMEKLHLENRSQAAVYAIEKGLVRPREEADDAAK